MSRQAWTLPARRAWAAITSSDTHTATSTQKKIATCMVIDASGSGQGNSRRA